MNQPNTQSLNTEVIVANTTQGEQHIHTTFKTQYILKDVEVLSRKKVGNDLIIQLKNGNTLIFHDYYKTQSLVTIEDTEAVEDSETIQYSSTSPLMVLPLLALGGGGSGSNSGGGIQIQ